MNADFGGGAKSYIESFKAKFVLNGPQTKPTKFCIQLVQLSETVTPGWAGTNDTIANAFWQAMSKLYGFSPLDPGPSAHLRKYLKVLKTMTVVMDSPESSEDHVNLLTTRQLHTSQLHHRLHHRYITVASHIPLPPPLRLGTPYEIGDLLSHTREQITLYQNQRGYARRHKYFTSGAISYTAEHRLRNGTSIVYIICHVYIRCC